MEGDVVYLVMLMAAIAIANRMMIYVMRSIYHFKVAKFLNKRGDTLLNTQWLRPYARRCFCRSIEVAYVGCNQQIHTRTAVCYLFGGVDIQISLKNIKVVAEASPWCTVPLIKVEVDGEMVLINKLPKADQQRIEAYFGVGCGGEVYTKACNN